MRHNRAFQMIAVSLLVTFLATPMSAATWSVNLSFGRWYDTNRWSDIFSLERDVTYVYRLKAYRWGRETQTGELSIIRSGSTVRMSYAVGAATGTVTSPLDADAMVGAMLLSALTGPRSVDYAGVQMLTTPFKFMQWHEMFAEADFRNGRVWEISGQPPIRFDAESKGWRNETVYEGEIRQGSSTLLELEIDLDEPLPRYVESQDGEWRFTAELRIERSTGRILR